MELGIVILAAGQGTRMNSALPKVLHKLANKPMLEHVIETAKKLKPKKIIIVYGHGGDLVKSTINDEFLKWAEQTEQLGTGHAVQQAAPYLNDVDKTLILYGDVPLLNESTLSQLVSLSTDLSLLTVDLEKPTGYGRIVRQKDGSISSIVEQKDATEDQLKISEINTGIMSVNKDKLLDWLEQIKNTNSQKEYYLTDIVELAVKDNASVSATQPETEVEVTGVNDRVQLAQLEREYQSRAAQKLMLAGASLVDPARFDLRGNLEIGQDVSFDINVIIEGNVTLGSNVSIGANTVIRNTLIADNVTILENCVIEDAVIGTASKIGPFARIRPGTKLVGEAHIGNFVELKNTVLGQGSKVNHLSYVGDSKIGSKVNVGAGVITCNYDGANKHKTIIGDNAFIGSNAALVAPVTINDGATIGAGSVITKEAKQDRLTLSRAKQVTVENWQRPTKNK